MHNYKHITKEERNEISILLKKGYGVRDIAGALDRDPGTISREVNRNRRKKRGDPANRNGPYEALVAQHKAYVRRKAAKYQGKKINENDELLEYIKTYLKKGWSPDVVSGRMALERQDFYASKTAIYEYCYSSYGQRLCKYLPSQRYDKRKRKGKKPEKAMIPNRVGIESRPEEITNRETYGHFEEDTIVSGKQHKTTTSLAVLRERKARYFTVRKIDSLKPDVHNEAVIDMGKNIKIFLSCTFDNGIENTKHETLQETLNIDTYFCDPYASWQKGGVENGNKQLRQYIPKGANLNDYNQPEIDKITDKINNIPRKSLDYKTPREVMIENGLLEETNQGTTNFKRASVALRG